MPRAGVTREKIFSLSENIANDLGYENLSMGHLARELGIRTPSLYKHVKDLEEIQEYLAVRGLSLLVERIENAGSAKGMKSFMERILEYRKFAHEYPGLYSAFQKSHVRRSAAVQREAKKLLDLIFVMLSELHVKKSDLLSAARMLRSSIHGFIDLEMRGGFGMPGDLDRSFKYMILVFVRGVSGVIRK